MKIVVAAKVAAGLYLNTRLCLLFIAMIAQISDDNIKGKMDQIL
jgi:hypothetical protein